MTNTADRMVTGLAIVTTIAAVACWVGSETATNAHVSIGLSSLAYGLGLGAGATWTASILVGLSSLRHHAANDIDEGR
jgi:hypothetical protein